MRVSVHERYVNENGTFAFTTHSIKTHPCTAEELGLPPLAEVKEEASTAREAAQARIKYLEFVANEPLLG